MSKSENCNKVCDKETEAAKPAEAKTAEAGPNVSLSVEVHNAMRSGHLPTDRYHAVSSKLLPVVEFTGGGNDQKVVIGKGNTFGISRSHDLPEALVSQYDRSRRLVSDDQVVLGRDPHTRLRYERHTEFDPTSGKLALRKATLERGNATYASTEHFGKDGAVQAWEMVEPGGTIRYTEAGGAKRWVEHLDSAPASHMELVRTSTRLPNGDLVIDGAVPGKRDLHVTFVQNPDGYKSLIGYDPKTGRANRITTVDRLGRSDKFDIDENTGRVKVPAPWYSAFVKAPAGE